MWWIIILIWVASSVMVIAPLIDEIENLERQGQKIFSYIILVLIAPMVLIVGFTVEILEKMGLEINEDDDNPWRNC